MRLIILLVLCLTLPLAARADFISYSGYLSSLEGGMQGTGFWPSDGANGGTTLSWVVSENGNGTWHYAYTLIVPRADASHVIIETSENFTTEDLLNPAGPYANYSIGYLAGSPGTNTQPNPFMPDDEYGIKFDSTYGTTLLFSFDSTRIPVWADFYAKCGNVGGTQNTIWNSGFITNEDNDPVGPVSNGSLAWHILAPDTQGDPAQSPSPPPSA